MPRSSWRCALTPKANENANEGDGMNHRKVFRTTGYAALLALLAACGGTGDQASESDGPETVTVPAGTEMVVALDEELSTRSHQEGDEFTARVASDVTASGATAIPAGTVVRGEVTAVQQADEEGKKGVLSLDVSSVEVRGEHSEVNARVVSANPEVRSETSDGEAAAKVGGGAAAGAILGRVIGGDGTGAAVGAAVGAAAGTGVVLATKDGYAVLPRGSNVRLELTDALTVPYPSGDGASGATGEAARS